ncbi:MAG: hypothetical protein ACREI8_01785, partial [Myxococcota bacterium]
MAKPVSDGVTLPQRVSASALLHRLLHEASERFADLAPARVPESGERFRRDFPEALARFESARAASAERGAIARFLVEASHRALGVGATPLDEAVREGAEPLELESWWMVGSGRLLPAIPYRGRIFRGREVLELSEDLAARELLAKAAQGAIRWLLDTTLDGAGELDLSGWRFALLGAGAELAPTPLLLEAGAEVLWIDLAAPPEALAKDSALSGRLCVPRGGAD